MDPDLSSLCVSAPLRELVLVAAGGRSKQAGVQESRGLVFPPGRNSLCLARRSRVRSDTARRFFAKREVRRPRWQGRVLAASNVKLRTCNLLQLALFSQTHSPICSPNPLLDKQLARNWLCLARQPRTPGRERPSGCLPAELALFVPMHGLLSLAPIGFVSHGSPCCRCHPCAGRGPGKPRPGIPARAQLALFGTAQACS